MTFKYGHWISEVEINPEEHFGFVYLIHCLVNNRKYIGKKQLHSYRKKKRVKETDWKTYTSSSLELNQDIKTFKKKNFIFLILGVYKTRGGLVYAEANLQHKYNVLTEADTKGRLWYNKQIGAIKFIPKEYNYP